MTFFFKKRIAILALCCALTLPAFSQSTGGAFTKIPANLLRQDFALLRDTLEKINPGLYRYNDKTTMDHLFDSCMASIKEGMTITGFYALTSYAIAGMEDGHTNCRLPAAAMNKYLSQVKLFPAMLQFIHNRVFIVCCNQDSLLAESELLSINHQSSKEIVERLFNYIPSDGGITSRKNWELSGTFPLLYSLVYGSPNRFTIEYKTKTGVIKTTELTADYNAATRCANLFTRPNKYLHLVYAPGNIAILTVRTLFNGFLDQTGEHFKQFLDSAFNDIAAKKVQKLLIDLRGNQGGNDDNGSLLYGYLTAKTFSYYASVSSTTKVFSEDAHPNLRVQDPSEINYTGKVYFLADGRSFSATAEFAAIAKSNNRGLFIGEEPGGGYYGNTSGDDITLNLPNSGISCRVPMVKYSTAVRKLNGKDNGIIPDYPVYPTITDLVENKDRQLEYALKIAAKK